jgi:CubicO group peptidase (beta-lactamase class C family)
MAALNGRPDLIIIEIMLSKINSFGIRRRGGDVRAWPMLALLLLVVLVALGLSQSTCAADRSPDNHLKTYRYIVPEKTNDGWETAALSSENLDTDLIKDLFERINDNTYKNIHSVLLVKNGKLVVEEYFPGQDSEGQFHAFQRDTLHELHSATKSVNSILIGIAIDQHLIRGVDEKISVFFPEYSDIFADGKKDTIELKHCLSMTAGLSWDEWTYPYADTRNDHVSMNRSSDPVRYALERPVVAPPGTKFSYNSGIAITLGEIIYKVSGLRADKFAERYLFRPLGISNYYWLKYPNGVVQTGGGLLLRPRDMAKIGYLFLNRGGWQGKRIVSEDWIRQSTIQHAPDRDYGYQWWLGRLRVRDRTVAACGAQGRGGQFIIVFPELQMVAVFTGWNDNASWDQPFDMLQQYILPAATSSVLDRANRQPPSTTINSQ